MFLKREMTRSTFPKAIHWIVGLKKFDAESYESSAACCMFLQKSSVESWGMLNKTIIGNDIPKSDGLFFDVTRLRSIHGSFSVHYWSYIPPSWTPSNFMNTEQENPPV